MSKGRIAIVALAAVVLAAGAVAGWIHFRAAGRPAGSASTRAVRYHCPMHPSIVSDKPGECPICHMTLVPMEAEPPAPSAAATPPPARKVIYRSTMNPSEVSDRPGKDSMGMDMVPVEEAEETGTSAGVPGLTAVRIPQAKQQLIGVKTELAAPRRFVRTIRTVGRVSADENRLWQVHTKVPGYVQTLFVRATGETVLRGAPLFSLDSPELQAAEQEYLVAYDSALRAEGSALRAVSASAKALLESARRRLELLDITPEQIRSLESTRRAERAYILRAPVSGTVLSRDVEVGQKVDLETKLMDLADLSHVWVLASVYEYEAPFVHQRQKATMTLSYEPGRTYDGWVTLVYPLLDPTTRTIQLRLEFDNPVGALKPDMYADVVLQADLGEKLSVPDSAVLRTGTRAIAFVAKGDGVFEPREVRLGIELPDRVEILSGVAAGERVLTSANFFVDSESKLKAALEAAASTPPGSERPGR